MTYRFLTPALRELAQAAEYYEEKVPAEPSAGLLEAKPVGSVSIFQSENEEQRE